MFFIAEALAEDGRRSGLPPLLPPNGARGPVAAQGDVLHPLSSTPRCAQM